VIVGAVFADAHGRDGSGSAYVVYGKDSTSTVRLASLGSHGFRMDGAAAGDNVGRSVGAGGDFNADGRPDVVTGGEFAGNNGTNSGSVYVQYGFGPPAFSYSPNVVLLTNGTRMTPLAPTGVKRTGTATFSAASDLPPGLTLDPATGTISGTWVSGGGSGEYTVVMTDLAGTATAKVTIKLRYVVEPPAPLAGTCGNVVNGTRAVNSLTGTAGGDLIQGFGGNDKLFGLAGNDCLYGGAGDDTLSGGAGKDKLDGGRGNDKLTGGKGKDTFTGGRGRDTINSKDGIREIVNCGPGRDKVKADKRDKLKGCEKRT
jgi:Ca2+-binding RTX toxin-like protein